MTTVVMVMNEYTYTCDDNMKMKMCIIDSNGYQTCLLLLFAPA